ncbi:FecCD family ABC transporter permease [Saccharothrix sp. ST-888]|uniref:FecCD family ABC transporter permease n=1 Tax=Saccharothrix sp. ST-888 TaxID=1427391 RepID=UPI000AB0A2AC|nr:iron chelate uptake ABC transporter family permease subunit [Saccharothrix sp. ST-888]
MADTPEPGRRTLLRRRVLWLTAALTVLLLAVVLSLAVGSRTVPFTDTLDALLHGDGSANAVVVRELRLPRTVVGLAVGAALGLAVGAALGLTGTVMQGLTRNPIADPGILGVSHRAAAGVVLAISAFGVGSLTGYVWFGFAGAVIATVAVYALAGSGRGGATPVKLALAGAAMSAFIASLTSMVLTTDSAAMDRFRFWQAGSLAGRTPEVAWQLLPFLLVGTVLVALVRRRKVVAA